MDLKIHDPDHSLGGRRRRGRRGAAESGGPATDEDESDDDVGNSIESMLIMKLVCKHGTYSEVPCTATDLWSGTEDHRGHQTTFITFRSDGIPTSRC